MRFYPTSLSIGRKPYSDRPSFLGGISTLLFLVYWGAPNSNAAQPIKPNSAGHFRFYGVGRAGARPHQKSKPFVSGPMRSLDQELQGNPSAAGLSMRLNSFYEGGQGAGEPEPVLGGKGPSAGFQKSAAPDPGRVYLKKGMDYKGLASKLQFVDLKTDLKSMPADQREVIGALLEILPLVDKIYRRQRSGDFGESVIEALNKSRDPRAKAALKLLQINSGPYDPWNDNAAIFNVPPYPKNGFAYPEDLSKEEFERYIQEHPEQKDELSSPYTAVRKNANASLSALYFHEAHRKEVRAIASLLRKAAAKTRHPGLKAYLRSKATDLLRDNFEESYGRWIALKDPPIELVLGPTESYDDSLAGVKEYYNFALFSKDNQGAEIIGKFAGMSQEMGRNLPLEERYNPYLKDPNFKPARNMAAVNMIAGGGDSRTYAAAGWTLPNEPEIAAKHGTKMLLIRNVIATRGAEAMRFVQRRLFGEAYDPDIFYWMVAGHELSHGMLPFTKGYDPKGQPLSQILGDLDLPVEEKKADLLGLMAVEEFAKKGEISWDSYWAIARMYVGAETVFRLYRNPNEAHARYSVAVHNLLKEKHAVSFDEAAGRMQVHSNFPQAVHEILSIFLKIQAEGDRGAAERLLSEHNAPAPEITAAIAALKKAGLSSQTHYNPIISK